MMTQEGWMNLRALKPLVDLGYSWVAIGDIAGCDWRTAKKYLGEDPPRAPAYGPRKSRGRLVDPYRGVIDQWLKDDPRSRPRRSTNASSPSRTSSPAATSASSSTSKSAGRRSRPSSASTAVRRCTGASRRSPAPQAQVDWGDEGTITTPQGELPVYSFHMVLSYSRDPFCCFVTSQDLATFWDCHRRAFDHFGGVPATILYDRTKTVVKNHVGRDRDGEVELHPEAVAFASHYDFAIRLCWPYRPETKGKVERVVGLTREKVLAGRTFSSTEEMDGAWAAWLPTRRAQVHRTHGEVIAVRAERDRAALSPIPPRPYVVSDRHLRVVGKDALVSFEASVYSAPWTLVRPGQRVELRITRKEVAIYTLGSDPTHLATHARAKTRGSWVVDEKHWDGLPDGTRAHEGPSNVVASDSTDDPAAPPGSRTVVAHRALSAYDQLLTKEDKSS